jgi:hypothetical protein
VSIAKQKREVDRERVGDQGNAARTASRITWWSGHLSVRGGPIEMPDHTLTLAPSRAPDWTTTSNEPARPLRTETTAEANAAVSALASALEWRLYVDHDSADSISMRSAAGPVVACSARRSSCATRGSFSLLLGLAARANEPRLPLLEDDDTWKKKKKKEKERRQRRS